MNKNAAATTAALFTEDAVYVMDKEQSTAGRHGKF
jgi:hypothetical protein